MNSPNLLRGFVYFHYEFTMQNIDTIDGLYTCNICTAHVINDNENLRVGCNFRLTIF